MSRHRPGLQRPASGVVTTVAWRAVVPRRSQRVTRGGAKWVVEPASDTRPASRRTGAGAERVVEPASDTRPAPRRTAGGADGAVECPFGARPASVEPVAAGGWWSARLAPASPWCAGCWLSRGVLAPGSPGAPARGAEGAVECPLGTRPASRRTGGGCREGGGARVWHPGWPGCAVEVPRGCWSARMAPRAALVRRVRALPLGRLARRRFTRNAGSPQCSSSGPRWAPRTRKRRFGR